jgi:ABC-type multidrug transport system ATPase subunit
MAKVKDGDFMGIVDSVSIEKFRKFENLSFSLGSKLTALVGQNGTLKTTLLGMISQPFSMYYNKADPDISSSQMAFFDEKTLDGYQFESKFADKFKFDKNVEKAGEHRYTLYFHDKEFVPDGEFITESIPRKEGLSEGIRLWNAKGRGAGEGYIHYPVIYLSLKRVSPIGEEAKVDITEKAQDYLPLFASIAKEILISPEDYTNLDFIKSSNKATFVGHPKTYGASTVSAGQDNIGKIITAILSFKMLKDKHPNEYRGGMLFIDEIDATLYPAAQKKMLEKLFRFASDFKIQIIFTTHSPTIIDTLFDPNYSHHSKVIFLKEISGKITCEEKLTLPQIEAKLNVSLVPQCSKPEKIRIYTEDEEARIFLKALLNRKYSQQIEILSVNLGANELISLVETRRIPEFKHNMIILDGDKIETKNHKNIIYLPGEDDSPSSAKPVGPDHLLYNFLYTLSDSDDFWPGVKDTGSYDKQFCFADYMANTTNTTKSRDFYKKWFSSQKQNWGSKKDSAVKYWIKKNPKQTDNFIKSFVKTYNFLAKAKNLPLIEQ